MIFESDELASAILFFDKNGDISREMLYPEFLAILDSYVPAIELSNQSFEAVYVEVNNKLTVKRAVFFTVSFTTQGFVDPGWLLPLEELARSGASGPDLGAGPILLACASSCPIAHHRGMLWDPDLRNGKGQFGTIRKVIKANRLGLEFRVSSHDGDEQEMSRIQQQLNTSSKIQENYEKEFRKHVAQLIKEQRFRAKTIANESEKALEELKKEHFGRLEEYRSRLEEKEKLLQEEKQKNQALKDTIDGQADKITGLREYFEHKLDQASSGATSEELNQLKENFEVELKAKVEAETKELKELLQMREVELLYRNEQEANLHDEISRLRVENQELLEHSGDQLLGKMVEKGISFVTYQPGAGHLTLPVTEVAAFMDNPTAYAAKSCGVSEGQYLAWIEHYHAPICRHTSEDGKLCGENIQRIDNPVDYIPEESCYCEKHRVIYTQVKLKLV